MRCGPRDDGVCTSAHWAGWQGGGALCPWRPANFSRSAHKLPLRRRPPRRPPQLTGAPTARGTGFASTTDASLLPPTASAAPTPGVPPSLPAQAAAAMPSRRLAYRGAPRRRLLGRGWSRPAAAGALARSARAPQCAGAGEDFIGDGRASARGGSAGERCYPRGARCSSHPEASRQWHARPSPICPPLVASAATCPVFLPFLHPPLAVHPRSAHSSRTAGV